MAKEANLTGLLRAWSDGDPDALAVLAPLVHQELRELARKILSQERRNARWEPTELIQESYLRLLDWRAVHWQNRAHFFATTARMMRRVLVDAARARRRVKRGEGIDPIPLEGIDLAASDRHADFLALEDALHALADVNTRASQVVELRFFGGCTVEETADALGVSVRTVINDWNGARAWLFHELSSNVDGTCGAGESLPAMAPPGANRPHGGCRSGAGEPAYAGARQLRAATSHRSSSARPRPK